MSKSRGRTAWLRAQYALSHHALPLDPLVRALQSALDWSGVFHSIHTARGGPNSNFLRLADGREYVIRGRLDPKPHLTVRQCGTAVTDKLTTERDVLRFVEGL